ncbi:hypothetical protein [Larkinella humicola]|uniref:Uncharacterized protein n=1 Tax=Larkinella humicola TaxID=2607654 RepID=A0A5N1JHV6_9BACT|nr:hypothetical protein [Larkinella humicola]KAA9355289.1 hypothetical protein F0P93_11990 [Larkinella humicola]
MERFFTLFVASLCAAPLFYFLFSEVTVALNSQATGPDARLGVAYLATWGGFLAAFVGFFVVWFLARYCLVETYLRYLQVFDGIALIGWFVFYLNWSDQQEYRLDYPNHRAVLEVEMRAAQSFLKGEPIDKVLIPQFIGQDLDMSHVDRIRKEGNFVILPWETTPISLKKWQMRVFVHTTPVDFPLDLPRRPQASTDWSAWLIPSDKQEDPLPDGALEHTALRYRFRLIPHGSPE